MARLNCPNCGESVLMTERDATCPLCGYAFAQPVDMSINSGGTAKVESHQYPVLQLLVTLYRVLAVVVAIAGGILAILSLAVASENAAAGLSAFVTSGLWTVFAVTGLIAVSEVIILAIRVEQNTYATRKHLETMAKRQTP